uniref:Uncharacterized protein n=1 Tax=Anguilla anguilla TaxID=7936 RepID=A0A0E9WJE6_ANGAN
MQTSSVPCYISHDRVPYFLSSGLLYLPCRALTVRKAVIYIGILTCRLANLVSL